jgi:small subunit ribosomal protein S21
VAGRGSYCGNTHATWELIRLEVIVQDGESLERALRKFKRKVQRSGLYSELRKRRFYEKPSAQKKRKREAAIRRERRKLRRDPRPRP